MVNDKVISIDLNENKSRKTIILSATTEQVCSIKTLLTLMDDRVESLGNDIYKLSISSKKVLVSKVLEKVTFGVATGKLKPKKIQIPDFDNSEKFYEDSRVGKGYKIISDEFSDLRNRELYKGFQLIEHKWRQIIVTTYAAQNKPISKPGRYSKKASDHAISTYELTEFLEQFLYAPASEAYMRKQWQESKSKSEDDVMRIVNLKQRDELNFGLTVDELNIIRNRRNQCMHFRVITSQEYKEVVPLINEYLRLQSLKEFINVASASLAQMIKQTQKSMSEMVQRLGVMSTIGTPFQQKFSMPDINFPVITNSAFSTLSVISPDIFGPFRSDEDELAPSDKPEDRGAEELEDGQDSEEVDKQA